MTKKPAYEELEQKVNELEEKLAERQEDYSGSKLSLAVFSGLIEASPDAIIMTDDKQNVVVWNPGAEKLFGYKKEEVLNCDYVNLVIPQKIIPVRDKAFQEAIKTRRLAQPGQTIETEGKRKGGTIFPLEHTVSIWDDTETGDIYVIAVLRDITKRIEIEKEKNRITTELKQLIETANAPIFGIDSEGKVNEWNKTMVKITGYNKEEVMGNDLVKDYITEEYKASVKEVFVKALNGEETANYEFPLYTKDGQRIMMLLNATTRRDADRRIVGVVGIGQDITELDKYRDKLENIVNERTEELNISLADAETARDKIDGIIKSISDGLIVTDIDNRVVLMNRAAEDILDVRFSEVIDRPIDYTIKDETLRDRMRATLNKEPTGYEFDFELPGSVPDQIRIMRARTSVIQDKDGRQQGAVTIIMDVTHEREVDRMKTEFLSTAAHELRTPLTSIMGFSEIILTRDNISPEEQRKFITYINEQSVGLNRIISDLLDISRIESGRGFILNKQPCEGGSAIKAVVSLFQEKHPKRQFEIVLPKKPVNIIADKDKMAQVLKNLVSNSVKYSPEGGKICLTGKVIDGCFQVSVEDHGTGMTPEQVDKVFDKFYRADASNTAVEGTGLGMSIVKHIVEAHGGKVWVESEYGKGTTVTFRIPL